MLSISLYLDKRKKAKNGFPVKLAIYDTKSQKQRQISFGQYQKGKTLRMTPELSKFMQKFHERVGFCNKYTLPLDEAVAVIRNGLDTKDELEIQLLENQLHKLKKEKIVDFEGFALEFIEEKKIKGLSIRHYQEALTQLKHYLGEKRLNINDMTYEFLNKFVLFKQRTGTGSGAGINKILRALRTIYLEAQRRESLMIKQDNPFKGIIRTVIVSKKEEESWEVEDIKKLFVFVPKQSTSKSSRLNMQRTIDIFLFQLAIGGHDMSDVANLRWKNIKDGRIRFQRFKNRNKPDGGPWINNKLFPFALKVIENYGDGTSERIFSFFSNPLTEKYRMQNSYQLKTLDRISKTLSIPKIKTKTPRYLFRTLAGELLIHDLIVMQLMGHKSTEVSHRYQKNLNLELQDEAHQRILEKVFNRL